MTQDSSVDILLVEDNPDDVELTLHALRRHRLGNHIQVARDGQEAIDYLLGEHAGNRPRVILLDLKLPRVDGLQVLRTLKANPHTQSIPIVMLTSSAETQDIAECYRLGANSYIVKPVDFDRFSEATRILGLYWLQYNLLPHP